MDIQRFFDTIDHATLKHLIRKKIKDDAVLHLTDMIIDSFVMHQTPQGATGLPLGNVTSQLFSNIYLHPLDHFVKQTLQQRHYLRYCDDFILVSPCKKTLRAQMARIQDFLTNQLFLTLHPKKIVFRKWQQGIDFLGYIFLPHHRLVRTTTKKNEGPTEKELR